jgi:hypothetical protein
MPNNSGKSLLLRRKNYGIFFPSLPGRGRHSRMAKEKWSMKRVHDDIYEARTKVFVVAKVLETGSVPLSEHPEWVLIVRHILKDLKENASQIEEILKDAGPLEGKD